MFDYSLAHNILNFGLVAGTGTLAVTLASAVLNLLTQLDRNGIER